MSDILANRRPYVTVALGNRADLSQQSANGGPSRIDQWIFQSYMNIGMSYPFHELEETVTGQWTVGMDFIAYPPGARRFDSIAFYQPNGTAIKISWKDIAYLRRYPASSATIPITNGLLSVGPPSIVAPFGEKLFVRPYADSVIYSFIGDIWLKPVQIVGQDDPTANPPYVSLGSTDIGATEILVPDDWLEIVDLGAILRGHISLIEREKAQEIQQLLFGFSMPQSGKMVPGLVAQALSRRQAQAPQMDYNIQPRQAKRSYTNVGS
jgi:hypothetical protein